MRFWLIFLYVIFCCSTSFVEAKNLQLFNAAVLGSSTQDSPQLFYDKKLGDIEPNNIQIDMIEGRYRGAIVDYGKQLSFEEAKESMNKLYKPYENISLARDSFRAWRLENEKFSIILVQEEENIQIIYNQFVPNEVLFKELTKFLCEQECKNEKAGKDLFGP